MSSTSDHRQTCFRLQRQGKHALLDGVSHSEPVFHEVHRPEYGEMKARRLQMLLNAVFAFEEWDAGMFVSRRRTELYTK